MDFYAFKDDFEIHHVPGRLKVCEVIVDGTIDSMNTLKRKIRAFTELYDKPPALYVSCSSIVNYGDYDSSPKHDELRGFATCVTKLGQRYVRLEQKGKIIKGWVSLYDYIPKEYQ